MTGESAPTTAYSDGLIRSPSERWLGPFDAMCQYEIAPGIDIAEADAAFPDDIINKKWGEYRKSQPDGLNKGNVAEFARQHFIFPVREARERTVIPGETIVEFSKRMLVDSFRYAPDDTSSQIGNSHAAFESGERFSDRRPGRARFYGWDQLPVCKAVLLTMDTDEWGLMSTASTLANRKEQAAKNKGVIGNANTSWGSTRDQDQIELEIEVAYFNHLYPMPKNLNGMDPLERMLTEQTVQRRRVEGLIEKVEFHKDRYLLWREGADDPTKLGLEPGSTYKHLARMRDGEIAFQPYDRADGARDEMRQADINLLVEWMVKNDGVAPTREQADLLTASLRRSAADGQDFREVDQEEPGPENFHTLRTAELATIKSNAIMYENATTLAYIYRQKAAIALENDDLMTELEAVEWAEFFEKEANNLSDVIHKYFRTDDGFCADYNVATGQVKPGNALAGVFALSAGVFSQEEGSRMLDVVEEKFGRPGGLVNTLAKDSKQQWDDNAWAIMQMKAVEAAIRYKRYDLAVLWATRWLDSNDLMFEEFHALYEKSDPHHPGKPGKGGEYECVENLTMSLAVDLLLRSQLGWLQEMHRNQLLVDRAKTEAPQTAGHTALRATLKFTTSLAARPQSRPRHTSPSLQNNERHTRPAKTARRARPIGRTALRP